MPALMHFVLAGCDGDKTPPHDLGGWLRVPYGRARSTQATRSAAGGAIYMRSVRAPASLVAGQFTRSASDPRRACPCETLAIPAARSQMRTARRYPARGRTPGHSRPCFAVNDGGRGPHTKAHQTRRIFRRRRPLRNARHPTSVMTKQSSTKTVNVKYTTPRSGVLMISAVSMLQLHFGGLGTAYSARSTLHRCCVPRHLPRGAARSGESTGFLRVEQ